MKWLIPSIIVFDVVLIAGAFFALRMVWAKLARPWPGTSPLEDAHRRLFQSWSFWFFNLSLSIHVSVDQDYLHLEPAHLLRLIGMPPSSIPWSAISIHKRHRFGKLITVRVESVPWKLSGPAWCLELAEDAPS